MKKVNRKRAAKRKAEAFGDKATWIRFHPCILSHLSSCYLDIEAHHVKSRGAGGKSDCLIPMCGYHHGRLHVMGRKTFEQFFSIELDRAAEIFERLWKESLA